MARKNSILVMIAMSIFVAFFTTVAVSSPAEAAKSAVARQQALAKNVNALRVSRGVDTVKANACLTREARKHARALANKRFSNNNQSIAARCHVAVANEIVASGLKANKLPLKAWSRSAAKRAILLGGNWDRMGAGAAVNVKGRVYYSLILAEAKAVQVPVDPPDDIIDDIDNPPLNLAEIEQGVQAITNTTRVEHGLAPLTLDACVDNFANAQAQAQADAMTMYHQQLAPVVEACGIFLLGENVAYGFEDAETVQEVWMNSPGHRSNILEPNYTHYGVGVAMGADGNAYFAVVFAMYPH